jgi:hypothetical protein
MLTNVPDITRTVNKWSQDEYLINKFGTQPRKVTVSESNHFMVSAGVTPSTLPCQRSDAA